MYEVGEKLKYVRRLKGYSQQMIAEATEVKRSTVAKIERDDQRPPLEFLVKFASVCEMKIDDLINMELQELQQPSVVEEPVTPYGRSYNAVFPMVTRLIETNNKMEREKIGEELQSILIKILDENADQKNELINLLRSKGN